MGKEGDSPLPNEVNNSAVGKEGDSPLPNEVNNLFFKQLLYNFPCTTLKMTIL